MTPDVGSLTTHPLWTTAADGLVLVEADGTIRAVNDNFERLFGHDADDLVGRGHDDAVVQRIWRLLEMAEYKRRQAPPGVKLTSRAFGRDRRYPITNAFKGKA